MSSNTSIKNSSSNKKGGLFVSIMVGFLIIIILYYVYSSLTSYYKFEKTSPYLISGLIDARTPMKFKAHQIPSCASSAYGAEFSYSCWLFIDDKNFERADACSDRGLLHVFHKGSYDYVPSGYQQPSNSQTNNSGKQSKGVRTGFTYPLLQMPGVWLYPNTNKLNIRFNTYENVVESSDIGNIPLNMWVNIIIILIGGSVDVYVNGNLKKRTKLIGVPKINYGDLYTTSWGGYTGYMSNLRYFNYAIQPFIIDQIIRMGPSTYLAGKSSNSLATRSNLSSNYWMTTGFPNATGVPGFKQNRHTTT